MTANRFPGARVDLDELYDHGWAPLASLDAEPSGEAAKTTADGAPTALSILDKKPRCHRRTIVDARDRSRLPDGHRGPRRHDRGFRDRPLPPGQALSFTIGARLWREARTDAERIAGPAFDRRDFHARALALGPMGLDPLRTFLTG